MPHDRMSTSPSPPPPPPPFDELLPDFPELHESPPHTPPRDHDVLMRDALGAMRAKCEQQRQQGVRAEEYAMMPSEWAFMRRAAAADDEGAGVLHAWDVSRAGGSPTTASSSPASASDAQYASLSAALGVFGGESRRGSARSKPRTYQDATPSKHCHICSARPSAASPHLVCANLARGTCRKTVCAKCFLKHGWDLAAARAALRVWRCPHCRGACPRAAQCFIYGRTTARRRQNALRARAASKPQHASKVVVAAAARRAALVAESLARRDWPQLDWPLPPPHTPACEPSLPLGAHDAHIGADSLCADHGGGGGGVVSEECDDGSAALAMFAAPDEWLGAAY